MRPPTKDNIKLVAKYLEEVYGPYKDTDEELLVVFAYQDPKKNTFWGEPVLLDDFLGDLEHHAEQLLIMNSNTLNIYYSILPHVKSKFEALREKKPKTRGTRETAYPKAKRLELDVDFENVEGLINHGKKIIYDPQKLKLAAKSLWASKIKPALEEVGITPRWVFYTGGGLKLVLEFTDFVDAAILLREFGKGELAKYLTEAIGEQAKKKPPEIAVDTAVFDEARVMRLPWTKNVGYTTPEGRRLYIPVEPLFESDVQLDFEEVRTKVRAWLNAHNLLKERGTGENEEDDLELWTEEEDPQELKGELFGKKFADVLRPYWKEGQRHFMALAFAGFLREKKIPEEDAKAIFGKVLDIFIGEGLDESKEVKDRWRAFEDTYKANPSEVSFGGPLLEKLHWDVKEVNKLKKQLERVWALNKKYTPIQFTALPKKIERIYEDGGVYTVFFKGIKDPFIFEGTKLIDRKNTKYGISYEKVVNKDFVIKLEAFFTQNNYALIWPKKVVTVQRGKTFVQYEVIDNDTVLGIMFSLMKRAQHLASTRDFEAVSAARLVAKALELAEDAVQDDKPPTAYSFAYQVTEDGERLVRVYVPSNLLLEAAYKLKLLKPSDMNAPQKLGQLLLKAKSIRLGRKLKNERQGGKVKFAFYYYIINGNAVEELAGINIEEIAKRVAVKAEEAFEDTFNFDLEEALELDDATLHNAVIQAIKELNKDGEGAPEEKVVKHIVAKGVNEDRVRKAIEKAIEDGYAYRPKENRLKLT
uniref:Primase/polymerase n=1 Tax=Thermococcus sp. IRI48 TaxID=1197734 RepID=L0BAN7_9EURY|nr:hypothetical protein [Thermococcus sp. IRI48]AFZ84239.1 Primase/polymerase [Thermococcus sp. IRI48]